MFETENNKYRKLRYWGNYFMPLITVILAVFLSGCWSYFPTYYKIPVRDEDGQPIPNAKMTFEYRKNLNISGKHGKWYRKNLTSNENGNAYYWGLVSYAPCVQNIRADGFYETRYSKMRETIILRKKQNPVPMYLGQGNAKDRWCFPKTDEKLSYDLIEQDFLPPYGKGKNEDCIFFLKSSPEKDPYGEKIEWDIYFMEPGDGIQVVYSPANSQKNFTFRGPYYAPETGYVRSLRDAENNFFDKVVSEYTDGKSQYYSWSKKQKEYSRSEIFRIYEPVFCFRVRSKTGIPLYGKIYGSQSISGQGIRRDGKFYLHLEYYLNPDGTRNLEASENLFDIQKKKLGNF